MAGSKLPYAYLVERAEEAQVDNDMTEETVRQRLNSHGEKLLRWSFQRVIERCREWGIPAYLLMVPDLGAPGGSRNDGRKVMEIGRSTGFSVVDVASGKNADNWYNREVNNHRL